MSSRSLCYTSSRTASGLSGSTSTMSVYLDFIVGKRQQALRTAHSRQTHKPSPPLEFAAEFDVVFASKRQFAVLANAEYRQCRWHVADIVAVANVHVDNARGDQDPAARVDAEGTDVKALGVFVLD